MIEEWAVIKGASNYKISNLGRVINHITNKQRKLLKDRKGYEVLRITMDNGDVKRHFVHRLVAKAFIPNPENKPQVNHIDCVKDNNAVTNLEWATQSENQVHAFTNKLYDRKGIKNSRAKIDEATVLNIKRMLNTTNYKAPILAKMFNCTTFIIHGIKRGKTWKHIS